MKRTALTTMLGLCIVASASAVGPQAQWLEVTHNFGAFAEETGVVTTKFRVVNTGDEPLLIVSARANCGCTTPAYPREPIAPGDTAVISVGFNPTGRVGHFNKFISVDTNDAAEAESRSRQQLKIEGTVIGSSNTIAGRYPAGKDNIRLRTSVAKFGRVGKGKVASTSMAGYNRSSDTLRLSLTDAPEWLSATIRPVNVPPGETFTALFSLNTNKCPLWGIVTDSVTLSDGDRGVTVSTAAIITDDFSSMSERERAEAPEAYVKNDMLDFGLLNLPASAQKRTLEIANTGRSPLHIRRAYSADDALEINPESLTVKPGKSAKIIVTLHPDKVKGSIFNARVMLITDDPARVQIPVRAVAEIKTF